MARMNTKVSIEHDYDINDAPAQIADALRYFTTENGGGMVSFIFDCEVSPFEHARVACSPDNSRPAEGGEVEKIDVRVVNPHDGNKAQPLPPKLSAAVIDGLEDIIIDKAVDKAAEVESEANGYEAFDEDDGDYDYTSGEYQF